MRGRPKKRHVAKPVILRWPIAPDPNGGFPVTVELHFSDAPGKEGLDRLREYLDLTERAWYPTRAESVKP